MKKILLFIGLLGIVSCRPVEEGEIKQAKSTVLEIESDRCWYSIDAIRFNYGGHTYISFNGNNNIAEILHDPDCGKCKMERE